MDQKRQGLYQAKDPSYYVDQFIRCFSARGSSDEGRRARRRGLGLDQRYPGIR